MQTALPPSPLRRLAAAVCLALLVLGCTSPAAPEPDEEPTGAEDVLQSREVLGGPMVTLGESVIALADALADARFEVERGRAMARALDGLPPAIATVEDAAAAAQDAAGEASVADAGSIVQEAAAAARDGAAAAEDEVAYLRRAQRVDAGLLAVAAVWDEPGSQSQLRARLDEAVDEAARLRRRARRLEPSPEDCVVMKRNRVAWAATVRSRTQRLQSQANSAGGSEYDELRSAYRRLPLGAELRSADQRERPCWEGSSEPAQAAAHVRDAVEELEAALQ